MAVPNTTILHITGHLAVISQIKDATLLDVFSQFGLVTAVHRWQNPKAHRRSRHVFVKLESASIKLANEASLCQHDGWLISNVAGPDHFYHDAYMRAKALPPIQQGSKTSWGAQITSMEKAAKEAAPGEANTAVDLATTPQIASVEKAAKEAVPDEANTAVDLATTPQVASVEKAAKEAVPDEANTAVDLATTSPNPASPSVAPPRRKTRVAPKYYICPKRTFAPHTEPSSPPDKPALAPIATKTDAPPAKKQRIDTYDAFLAMGAMIEAGTRVAAERRARKKVEQQLAEALEALAAEKAARKALEGAR